MEMSQVSVVPGAQLLNLPCVLWYPEPGDGTLGLFQEVPWWEKVGELEGKTRQF